MNGIDTLRLVGPISNQKNLKLLGLKASVSAVGRSGQSAFETRSGVMFAHETGLMSIYRICSEKLECRF